MPVSSQPVDWEYIPTYTQHPTPYTVARYNDRVKKIGADKRGGLPAIGRVMTHPAIVEALARMPRGLVADSLRSEGEIARATSSHGDGPVDADVLANRPARRADMPWAPTLRCATN